MLEGLSVPLPEAPRNAKYVMTDGEKLYYRCEDGSIVWTYMPKGYYLTSGGLRRIGKPKPYWYLK